MKHGENWISRFTEGMNLPTEPITGLPLVEICGNQRVLIENHLGVIQYARTRICVKVSYGVLSVQGSCLELARMSREQLVIRGCVDCVSLHSGEDGR